MEKDPHISRLMKEGALNSAPKGFVRGVMDQLQEERRGSGYQPLIGRWGRFWIGSFVLLIIGLSILLYQRSTPGEEGQGLLGQHQISLPEISMNLDFFTRLNPSMGVAAAILAFFILVFFDARMKRNRRLA